jgi:polyisoprenoid-binding protein YceI
LTFNGDKVVSAEGDFTLLGVSKPVKLGITGFRCKTLAETKKKVCGGDVKTTLKRSDFGMTKYIPEVSDEVKITVPVEAVKD